MIGGEWDMRAAGASLERFVTQFARDEAIGEALVIAAQPVAAEMGAEAPRDPPKPDMADAMTAAVSVELSGPGEVCVSIGPKKSHPHGFLWRFFELGTSKLAALGIMRRVWDGRAAGFTAAFVRAVRGHYEKAIRDARAGGLAMIERAIATVLLADAAVAALIEDRLGPMPLVQADNKTPQVPAITYKCISLDEPVCLDGQKPGVDARVQLDCWASTVADVRALADAVRTKLNGFAGQVDGVSLVAFLKPGGGGGDEYEPDTKLRRVRMDFSVSC